MRKIRVRVPATSANVGSGFDCAGIAFQLYNEFEFEKLDSGFVIEGCEEKFANEENLANVAYKAIQKLARPYKDHRQLDILRIEYPSEKAG